ncbi:MAG: phospholipase D-like domain-containing protein [Methanomassiliicoccales archaeon]|nr:phospholipase D-like domain-containing protein [Methanomassiliicoccales archaeon]
MRGALCLIILLILLPIGQGFLSSPGASASSVNNHNILKLCEVLPRFPYEHIGIINMGASSINLTGWSLSDGEGSWTFDGGPILDRRGELYVGPNLTFMRSVHPGELVVDALELYRKGRLTMADEGDEVLLLDPQGVVVDAMAYGKSNYVGAGWTGDKATSPSEGKALRRSALSPYSDTDTKSDWSITTLGRTGFSSISASALVEPFLCPEEMRSRMLREIGFAHESISVEVYILSDLRVASALAAALERGVRVRVLVEGEPVGGLTDSQEETLQALSDQGCEIHITSAFHGFKRYDYLHPKVLVVDGRRALIASENFASSSMENNRGWGVVVDSPIIAAAFQEVFEKDIGDGIPDIRRLEGRLGMDLVVFDNVLHDQGQIALGSLNAKVRTVLAPDFSYPSILGLISQAQRRLLLELYYLSDQWDEERDVFQSVIDAARRGVSVRLLLDGSWYNNEEGRGNGALAKRMNDIAEQEGLDLRAKTLSPLHSFETLHNKGLVSDDLVLISSINWVRASFERNREVGAIIESAEVAEFFAQAFETDWVDDAIAPELMVQGSTRIKEGEMLVLNATALDNSGSARISWDVGLDGTIEGEGAFFVARLPPGEALIRVTALDPSNNSCSLIVNVTVAPSPEDGALIHAASVPALVAISIWALRKRVKRQ